MGNPGRSDIVEDVRDRLAGRPPVERPKGVGRADIVTAEEEVRFRKQLATWRNDGASSNNCFPELGPVTDQDGIVMPLLIQVAARYVKAVSLAFCDDVLVAGVPSPLEIVDIVERFPRLVADEVYTRHDLSVSLSCWDAVVETSEYPTWGKAEALEGPIDKDLFVSLTCGFCESDGESAWEAVHRRVDEFWEEQARVLRLHVDGTTSVPTQTKADRHNPTIAFPNRAAWLRDRLQERGWNKYRLGAFGGPAHKTTQKVLDGLSVQEGVLEQIARALSKKIGAVVPGDIPGD